MFGKQELLDKMETLIEKNENLQKRLEDKYQKERNVVYDDIDGCIHAFDWEAVGAFSIERNMKEQEGELIAYTIIGYQRSVNDDGNICTGEWMFICSQEEHNRLAKEFQAYLASKKPVKATPKPTLLTETATKRKK